MSSHAKKSAAIPDPAQSTNSATNFEQRMDVLAAKVDLLLAAFGLSEGAADARWRTVAGENANAATALHGANLDPLTVSQSAQIGAQFAALRLRRDALRLALPGADKDWTPEFEARADAELTPLSHRLFSLAHELSVVPAREIHELKFKALALQEYCEENSDDVVHLLAASLAADVLARAR
jgi:hypothetical protein